MNGIQGILWCVTLVIPCPAVKVSRRLNGLAVSTITKCVFQDPAILLLIHIQLK